MDSKIEIFAAIMDIEKLKQMALFKALERDPSSMADVAMIVAKEHGLSGSKKRVFIVSTLKMLEMGYEPLIAEPDKALLAQAESLLIASERITMPYSKRLHLVLNFLKRK